MMQKKNRKQWAVLKLILFLPVLAVLLQAFARPELIRSADDFIPEKYEDEKVEKWLERWTIDNIKHGVYQPNGLKTSDFPIDKNNKLLILLTKENRYMINREEFSETELLQVITNFIDGECFDKKIKRNFLEKEIPLIGKIEIPQSFITLQFDKGSTILVRSNLLRAIGEIYLEKRQQEANKYFGTDYLELNIEQKDIVDELAPILFGYSSVIISPPRPMEITLTKNGKIKEKGWEFSVSEFGDHIVKLNQSIKEIYKKRGYERSLMVNLKVEDGVSETQLRELKEVLRKANIQEVNYSQQENDSSFPRSTKDEKNAVDIKVWCGKERKFNAKLLANNKVVFNQKIFLLEDFKDELLEILDKQQTNSSIDKQKTRVVLTIGTEKTMSKGEKNELLELLDDIDVLEIYALSNTKKPIVKSVYRKSSANN